MEGWGIILSLWKRHYGRGRKMYIDTLCIPCVELSWGLKRGERENFNSEKDIVQCCSGWGRIYRRFFVLYNALSIL